MDIVKARDAAVNHIEELENIVKSDYPNAIRELIAVATSKIVADSVISQYEKSQNASAQQAESKE